MPKYQYSDRIKAEDWKVIRAQLCQGNHLDKAKEYIQKNPGPIRVFIPDGEGFGDQMFPLIIIEQLRQLGFKGKIEIICHFKALFSYPYYPSALKNILKLYDAEDFFNHKKHSLSLKLINNNVIDIYDYNFFKRHIRDFPEVELALFPGLIHQLYRNYQRGSLIPTLFRLSYTGVLDQMTSIAKSKTAIFLSPHTAQFISYQLEIGAAIQIKGSPAKIDFHSQVLGYRVSSTPFSEIEDSLLKLKKHQAVLGGNIERLVRLKKANEIDTFSIYAIHHFASTSDKLINFLLASQLVHSSRENPLFVLVMSPITNESWEKVKMARCQAGGTLPELGTCLNNFLFFELQRDTLAESFDSKDIHVLRLPSTPWKLFNYLFNSTYPPVYEGANSAMVLQRYFEQPRFGLPCPKFRSQGGRFVVGGEAELPEELITAGANIICPKSIREIYHDNITGIGYWPYQYLAFIMAKYTKGHELPPGLPSSLPALSHNRLEFTNPPSPSFELADDRLAYALALASQEPTPRTDLESCEIQMSSDCEMLMHASYKGFFYGFFKDSTARVLKTTFSDETADYVASNIQCMLKGFLDGQISAFLLLIASELILNFASLSAKNKKKAQLAFTALLFMIEWLPELFDADYQEQSFISSIIALSWFFHFVGQRTSQAVWQGISSHSFFSASTQSHFKSDENEVPHLPSKKVSSTSSYSRRAKKK